MKRKKVRVIKMNDNKLGGNFFSGFLLGALVGAAVVFFLGTKKGKRILEVISEEGAGKISNILDKIDKSVDLPDESLEDEEFSFAASDAATAGKGSNGEEEIPIGKTKPKIRRFFRGVSKRVN
jgi:gas vesicle protein